MKLLFILIDFAHGNKGIVPPEKHKAVTSESGDGFDPDTLLNQMKRGASTRVIVLRSLIRT